MERIETLEEMIGRYPKLENCKNEIKKSAEMLIECYESGNCLYTCGNGGSAADSDHIVGELMKGFLKKRPLTDEEIAAFGEDGEKIARGLQRGLGAMSLHSQSSLLTAYMNDEDPALVYAQTLYSLGRGGDVLIAISTSGNSENVLYAAKVAKAKGIKVIAMVGERSCKLDGVADVVIHVGDTETYRVQELHLPVYHWLCAAVEDHFFKV